MPLILWRSCYTCLARRGGRHSGVAPAPAIRADLESAGTPLGSNALLIAAHATALRMPLVTTDAAFRQGKGLQVENWLE